jgi:hypothetical protein
MPRLLHSACRMHAPLHLVLTLPDSHVVQSDSSNDRIILAARPHLGTSPSNNSGGSNPGGQPIASPADQLLAPSADRQLLAASAQPAYAHAESPAAR